MPNSFGQSNPFAGLSGLPLEYLNAVPSAGWGAYTNAFANNEDPFSRWLRSQLNRYYTSFEGQNAWQPNLTWTDYLQGIDPAKDFAGLSRQERGINPGNWLGRTRWSL
jgi:hypothetical protein